MLCTLLKPTFGMAVVDGHNVLTEPTAVRKSIGIIFQDPSLDNNLTAMENLYLHCLIYHVPAREQRKRMEQVLDLVGLAEVKSQIVSTYSGGMKRRLEIARGLLHYPRLLFLDEPTLGLDPQSRSHIWDYISRLKAEHGITVFMTTHYMEEAENCDRIAIIDHGRIIALDTPANLKREVRNDTIVLTTTDDGRAGDEIKIKYGLDARRGDSCLEVEVADGESFLPELSRGLETQIKTISLRKPTLDDVFLKLTGREIRKEEASGRDRLRDQARRRRRI
jgi:ABC-2 type transport system ATP-binding protein